MPRALLLILLLPTLAVASPCEEDPAFSVLDFWVGEWEVRVGDQLVGHNRIERLLGGCALMEHWSALSGGEGKSLFYYLPATSQWKQVWVTANPHAPGGVKEKLLVERREDGSLLFQGEIPLEGGGAYLDRTTLTPLADGRVRQRIETSADGGAHWSTRFDAVYVRAGER